MTQKTFLIKAVVLVSLISMLLSCFCACSEQDPYAEIHPVPLPEGVNLTALFLHNEGSCGGGVISFRSGHVVDDKQLPKSPRKAVTKRNR